MWLVSDASDFSWRGSYTQGNPDKASWLCSASAPRDENGTASIVGFGNAAFPHTFLKSQPPWKTACPLRIKWENIPLTPTQPIETCAPKSNLRKSGPLRGFWSLKWSTRPLEPTVCQKGEPWLMEIHWGPCEAFADNALGDSAGVGQRNMCKIPPLPLGDSAVTSIGPPVLAS